MPDVRGDGESMKLRLLLFESCHRHCEGCCNEGFDLRNLPVCMDWRGWDQILLTGGEPMLRPDLVARVIGLIRESVQTPIYLYTADTSHPLTLIALLRGIEGVTVTLHEQEQVEDFEWLLEMMQGNYRALEGKSLRLNVFEGVDVEGLTSRGGRSRTTSPGSRTVRCQAMRCSCA